MSLATIRRKKSYGLSVPLVGGVTGMAALDTNPTDWHDYGSASSVDHKALARHVQRARAEVEACFAEASSVVLGTSSTVSDLGGLVEPLGTLVENLRAADDLSNRMAQAMRAEADNMQTVSAALNDVMQPVDQLARVIRTVGLVGLGARVAAGSLGSKKHVQFVEDVRALAIEAGGKIKEVRDMLNDVAGSLLEVGETQQAFRSGYADRFGSLVSMEKDQQDLLQKFASDAEAAAALASQISAQATDGYGDLAMALFAGDAVSQRLDHVAAALAEVTPHEPEVAALQRRQTEGALAALNSNLVLVGRAHGSLTKMVEEFKALLSRMVRRQGEADGQLPYLKKSLSRALAVLTSSQAQRRGLDKQIAQVTAKLENLFERISGLASIERRLQLVSLNLSINCQSGGDDQRTLATIAAQLMELALETRRLISQLTAALERVKTRAREFRRTTERDTVGEIGRLGKSAAGPLRSLDAVLGKFELEEQLWVAVTDLESSGARLAALRDVSAALSGAVSALEDWSGRAAPGTDKAVFEQLRAAYTMQDEREIHDNFMLGLFPGYAGARPQEDMAPKLELF